jgi:hypothetical protein
METWTVEANMKNKLLDMAAQTATQMQENFPQKKTQPNPMNIVWEAMITIERRKYYVNRK